jgi:hypothetical protein
VQQFQKFHGIAPGRCLTADNLKSPPTPFYNVGRKTKSDLYNSLSMRERAAGGRVRGRKKPFTFRVALLWPFPDKLFRMPIYPFNPLLEIPPWNKSSTGS